MIAKEPRDPRSAWQQDYNKWWNEKMGTPVEEKKQENTPTDE